MTLQLILRYKECLKQYANNNQIKITRNKKNTHICIASNNAAKLATGEYLVLLDHDDMLWPNALFEFVNKLQDNPKLEFIYSDEERISADSSHRSAVFFKPDWSPDYLRAVNYITHCSFIKKSLFDKLGGFRKGYEGAQDWDLFFKNFCLP